MEPEADLDGGREGFVPTASFGGCCPFRGQRPFRVELDDRCPPRVAAMILPVVVREGAAESHPVPVLSTETYCRACVDDMVREVEAGAQIGDRKAGTGKARPVARAKRRTLKQMAERFK